MTSFRKRALNHRFRSKELVFRASTSNQVSMTDQEVTHEIEVNKLYITAKDLATYSDLQYICVILAEGSAVKIFVDKQKN